MKGADRYKKEESTRDAVPSSLFSDTKQVFSELRANYSLPRFPPQEVL